MIQPWASRAARARSSGRQYNWETVSVASATPIPFPCLPLLRDQTATSPSRDPEARFIPRQAKVRVVIGCSWNSRNPGSVPSGPSPWKLQTVTSCPPPVAKRIPFALKANADSLPAWKESVLLAKIDSWFWRFKRMNANQQEIRWIDLLFKKVLEALRKMT